VWLVGVILPHVAPPVVSTCPRIEVKPQFSENASIFVIHEPHTSACCVNLLNGPFHTPATCLGWGHGLPGARGMTIDAGAEISRNSRVQIGSIGVEISFKALDKFGIYRIGIESRISTANPRSGSTGILVTPPAFEIARPSLINRPVRFACRPRLPSLAKVCLSQPVRRQTMPIFSPFHKWSSRAIECCFLRSMRRFLLQNRK
jgi:hypothetical protein